MAGMDRSGGDIRPVRRHLDRQNWPLATLAADWIAKIVFVSMKKNSEMGFPAIVEKGEPLQIGFIPDGNCAPLAVARESGLFKKYELNVELRRETRLSNIRDRLIEGDLHAVH